jgi:hypothetical protein
MKKEIFKEQPNGDVLDELRYQEDVRVERVHFRPIFYLNL